MSAGPCQGAGRYAIQCGRRVHETLTTPNGHTFGLCHLHQDQFAMECALIDRAVEDLDGAPLLSYLWRRWPTAMLAAEVACEGCEARP